MYERFYQIEDHKYRHLRFVVTPKEVRKVLKSFFELCNLKPIPITFKRDLRGKKNTPIMGVFTCPEEGFEKVGFSFAVDDLELLAVIHEFSHYRLYCHRKWGTYKVHGRLFYKQLDDLVTFYKTSMRSF